MTDNKTFSSVASDLLRAVDAALPKLRAISERGAAKPRLVGLQEKWSPKQVIGHLIDSAANNHQRFVRAQQGPLTFPRYAQNHWVDCQRYQDRPWADLVAFWEAYNRHLAHVLGHIPDDRLGVACTVESNEPVTLGFLAADYVVHLRHHLAQVGAD
jgi:hypothetical protein